MKIVLQTSISGSDNFYHKFGDTVDFPEEFAQRLLDSGQAILPDKNKKIFEPKIDMTKAIEEKKENLEVREDIGFKKKNKSIT